jgi:uncharacterized protein (DUF433 family)
MGLDRITRNPDVMGGKPCLRGMRVTVGAIVGLVASLHSNSEILAAYPYLEEEDIRQALAYAAWRVEEIELLASNVGQTLSSVNSNVGQTLSSVNPPLAYALGSQSFQNNSASDRRT